MTPASLLLGFGAMLASASGTLWWLAERELDALDHSFLTADVLDESGRFALEGGSFLRPGDDVAGPSASRVPRGLPSDPNVPESGPNGSVNQHAQGEHSTARNQKIPAPVQGDDGAYAADFAHLLFESYDPPELRPPDKPQLTLEEFPEYPQLLHGKEVRISGFMIAADFKDRKVERFLLGRFPPGCCYGQFPLYDEWIEVDNAEADAEEYSAFETLTVRGTLDVGEVLDYDGYVLSMYRLKATSVKPLY